MKATLPWTRPMYVPLLVQYDQQHIPYSRVNSTLIILLGKPPSSAKENTDASHAHRRETGRAPTGPTRRSTRPPARCSTRLRTRRSPTRRPPSPPPGARSTPPAGRRDAAFRARCLDQLHQALTEHKEELRELTIADVGAPRVITYGAQLDEPIEIVRYYADLLPGYPLTQELGRSSSAASSTGAGWRRSQPASSPRSSATTTRPSSRWPSCRPRWRPAARWCSRPRRTLR